MSFFDEVMGLVQKADSDIKSMGDDLKKDLKTGTAALTDEIESLKTKLQQDINNLGSDFSVLISQGEAAYGPAVNDIVALSKALQKSLQDTNVTLALSAIKTAAASQANTAAMYNNMMTVYKSLMSNLDGPLTYLDGFNNFACSAGAEGGAGIEFDGDLGFAVKTNTSDYRVMADVSSGIGADLDLDLGAYVGLFQSSPNEMKGAVFAVRVDAEEIVGGGATAICKLSFSPPKVSLDGVALGLTTGEGVELGTLIGYTFTWK